MGNRNSHNFTTSSRSASFSDLPYKLGNTSYTSKKGARSVSSASTLPRPTKEKPLTQQRSTSLVSLNDKSSNRPSSVADKPVAVKRASTVSLPRQQQTTTTSQPAPRQFPDPQPTGPRQYNDNFLQSDVKKLFKVNDKRKSQAIVQNVEDNTAEGLDEKLAILKKQRSGGDETDEAKTKKSRKAKKAPSLPPTKTTSTLPINAAPRNSSLTNGVARSKTPQRKKSAAPAPPTAVLAPPMTAPVPNDNNNNRDERNEQSQISKPEPFKSKPDIKAAEEPEPSKSKPDTKAAEEPEQLAEKQDTVLSEEFSRKNTNSEPLEVHRLTKEAKPVVVTERELRNTSTLADSALPSVNQEGKKSVPTVATSPEQPKRKTVIERELTSTKRIVSSKKQSKAPQVPPPSVSQTSSLGTVRETDLQLQIDATDEDTFIEAITNKALQDGRKTQSKEVAVQYNTPVDIAIQCDDTPLDGEKEDGREAGGILKLFIDKNAKKDATRDVDERSPDGDAIFAELDASRSLDETQTESMPSKTEISMLSNNQDGVSSDKGDDKSASVHSDAIENECETDPACSSIEAQLPTSMTNESVELPDIEDKDDVSFVEDIIEQSITEAVNSSSSEINANTGDNQQDVDQQLTPESEITDQLNCPTPRNPPNENGRILGVDVSPVVYGTLPTNLSVTVNHSTEPHVNKDHASGGANDAATTPRSPVVETPVSKSTPTVQVIFPMQDFVNTSAGATHYPTSGIFVPEEREDNKETKKHKSKYGGIFRITKTMRRFMSSVGKSSKSHKEEEIQPPEEDEPTFAADNWTLTDSGRKPTPRKEYKPTWNEETFKDPVDKVATPSGEHETESNPKAETLSDNQHTESPGATSAAPLDDGILSNHADTPEDGMATNVAVSAEETALPAKTALPEEIALSEETALPEEAVLPEEPVLPEEAVLPGKAVLPEESVPAEETVLSEETVLPEETTLPDKNIQPNETALPEDTVREDELAASPDSWALAGYIGAETPQNECKSSGNEVPFKDPVEDEIPKGGQLHSKSSNSEPILSKNQRVRGADSNKDIHDKESRDEKNQTSNEVNTIKEDKTTEDEKVEHTALSPVESLPKQQFSTPIKMEEVTMRNKLLNNNTAKKTTSALTQDTNDTEYVGSDTTPNRNRNTNSRETYEIKRRSSTLALMTPKAYGSSSSVYRPVSKLLSTTSPS